MVEVFDGLVLVSILFTMLASSYPKKGAMTIVLLVAVTGMWINHYGDAIGWHAVPPMMCIVETFAACMLWRYRKFVISAKDRYFFLLMICFLVVSAIINFVAMPGRQLGFMPHEAYLIISKSIAIVHLLVMAWYSDGISNCVTNIRGYISSFVSSLNRFRRSQGKI